MSLLRNDTVSFWFWGYIGDIRTQLQAPVVISLLQPDWPTSRLRQTYTMTTDGSTYSTEVGTSIPGGNFTSTFTVTTQDYITTQEYVTTTEESDTIPEYVGFIAVIIAILLYGITYAPGLENCTRPLVFTSGSSVRASGNCHLLARQDE